MGGFAVGMGARIVVAVGMLGKGRLYHNEWLLTGHRCLELKKH